MINTHYAPVTYQSTWLSQLLVAWLARCFHALSALSKDPRK